MHLNSYLVGQLLFLHLVPRWFPLWLHGTKDTFSRYLDLRWYIRINLYKPKAIIIITSDFVFFCSMLFELLPGGAAVVSSLGAAVVSSEATWNNRNLT